MTRSNDSNPQEFAFLVKEMDSQKFKTRSIRNNKDEKKLDEAFFTPSTLDFNETPIEKKEYLAKVSKVKVVPSSTLLKKHKKRRDLPRKSSQETLKTTSLPVVSEIVIES